MRALITEKKSENDGISYLALAAFAIHRIIFIFPFSCSDIVLRSRFTTTFFPVSRSDDDIIIRSVVVIIIPP